MGKGCLNKIQVCFPRERFGERVSIRKYSSVPPGKAQGRGFHRKIQVCFPGGKYLRGMSIGECSVEENEVDLQELEKKETKLIY